MSYSGELTTDSPALAGTIRKRFPQANLIRLTAIYRWSVEHGGCEEVHISRAPGASFNPRVARICQLLMVDGGVSDESDVGAAMIASTSRVTEAPPIFEAEREIAIQAQSSEALANSTSGKIAFCLRLDLLRHLHMSKNLDYRHSTIQHIAQFLDSAKTWENDRLFKMLHSAHQQQQTLLRVHGDK